jgi:hypothetical protein
MPTNYNIKQEYLQKTLCQQEINTYENADIKRILCDPRIDIQITPEQSEALWQRIKKAINESTQEKK